jgi:hypothetical protein
MNRITLALLLLVSAVSGLAMTARAQQDASPEEASQPQPEPSMTVCKPDRILVKVQDGVDAAAVVARYGGTILRTIPGIEVQVVNVPHAQGQQIIDAMSTDPEVRYAEADQIVRATAQGASGC